MKSLLSLRPGEAGRIIKLMPGRSDDWRKLLALGLFPGVVVEVEQVFPAYVLRVGFTELALDKETAGRIIVVNQP
ncbi:MAG: ferrous iron transport protein A [Sporomusaceae bacterium]|jgi:Fe2+ transport system protein FeoA|nr:ferrous iron transport protein A [Sporomusaceae bacterium]